MDEKKIHSIFLGRKVRKYYVIKDSSKPELIEKTDTLERVIVKECFLDSKLRVDDEIFLEDLNTYATIQKVTITDKNNVVYNISYVVEEIDDLVTTKMELENQLKERVKEYEDKQQQDKHLLESNKQKYKELLEWQKNNPDKILGTIILKCNSNSWYRPSDIKIMQMAYALTVPREYCVIVTDNDVKTILK